MELDVVVQDYLLNLDTSKYTLSDIVYLLFIKYPEQLCKVDEEIMDTVKQFLSKNNKKTMRDKWLKKTQKYTSEEQKFLKDCVLEGLNVNQSYCSYIIKFPLSNRDYATFCSQYKQYRKLRSNNFDVIKVGDKLQINDQSNESNNSVKEVEKDQKQIDENKEYVAEPEKVVEVEKKVVEVEKNVKDDEKIISFINKMNLTNVNKEILEEKDDNIVNEEKIHDSEAAELKTVVNEIDLDKATSIKDILKYYFSKSEKYSGGLFTLPTSVESKKIDDFLSFIKENNQKQYVYMFSSKYIKALITEQCKNLNISFCSLVPSKDNILNIVKDEEKFNKLIKLIDAFSNVLHRELQNRKEDIEDLLNDIIEAKKIILNIKGSNDIDNEKYIKVEKSIANVIGFFDMCKQNKNIKLSKYFFDNMKDLMVSDIVRLLFPYINWRENNINLLLINFSEDIYNIFDGTKYVDLLQLFNNNIVFIDEGDEFKRVLLRYFCNNATFKGVNEFFFAFIRESRKYLTYLEDMTEERFTEYAKELSKLNIDLTQLKSELFNFIEQVNIFYETYINKDVAYDSGLEFEYKVDAPILLNKIKNGMLITRGKSICSSNDTFIYYNIIHNNALVYPIIKPYESKEKIEDAIEFKDVLISIEKLLIKEMLLYTKYENIQFTKNLKNMFATLLGKELGTEIIRSYVKKYSEYNIDLLGSNFSSIYDLYTQGIRMWSFEQKDTLKLNKFDTLVYPISSILFETPENKIFSILKNNHVIFSSPTIHIERSYNNFNFSYFLYKIKENNIENIFYFSEDEYNKIFNKIIEIEKNKSKNTKLIEKIEVVNFQEDKSNLENLKKELHIFKQLEDSSSQEYVTLVASIGLLKTILQKEYKSILSFNTSNSSFFEFIQELCQLDQKALSKLFDFSITKVHVGFNFLTDYVKNRIFRVSYKKNKNLVLCFVDSKCLGNSTKVYGELNIYELFLKQASLDNKIWICAQTCNSASLNNISNFNWVSNKNFNIDYIYYFNAPFNLLNYIGTNSYIDTLKLEDLYLLEESRMHQEMEISQIDALLSELLETNYVSEESKICQTDDYYLSMLAVINQALNKITNISNEIKEIGIESSIAEGLKKAITVYNRKYSNIPLNILNPIFNNLYAKCKEQLFHNKSLNEICKDKIDTFIEHIKLYSTNGSDGNIPLQWADLSENALAGNYEYRISSYLLYDEITDYKQSTTIEKEFCSLNNTDTVNLKEDYILNLCNQYGNSIITSYIDSYYPHLLNDTLGKNKFLKHFWFTVVRPRLEEKIIVYLLETVTEIKLHSNLELSYKLFDKCNFYSPDLHLYFINVGCSNSEDFINNIQNYKNTLNTVRDIDPEAKLILVGLLQNENMKEDKLYCFDANTELLNENNYDNASLIYFNCLTNELDYTNSFQQFFNLIEKLKEEVYIAIEK